MKLVEHPNSQVFVGKHKDEKTTTHIPHIVDMGSYKIDLNAPKRHVPNKMMRDAHLAKIDSEKPVEKGTY